MYYTSEEIVEMLRKFHGAIGRNDIRAIQHFMSKDPFLINAKDVHGETAIFRAVLCKRTELVDYLVEHGANCDIMSITGDIPLTASLNSRKWIPFGIVETLFRETKFHIIRKHIPDGVPYYCPSVNIYQLLCGSGVRFTLEEFGILLEIIKVKNRTIDIDINQVNNEGLTAFENLLLSKPQAEYLKLLIQHGATIPPERSLLLSKAMLFNPESPYYKVYNTVRNEYLIKTCKLVSVRMAKTFGNKSSPAIELPEEIHRIILGYLQPLERAKSGAHMWGKLPLRFWDRVGTYL